VPTLSRHYFSTVAANALILLLGIASGVLAARLLGPEGRGELAVVTLWPLNLGLLGSLGFNQALTYFSAKHPERTSAIWTSALVMAAVQSAVLAVIGFFALAFVLRAHPEATLRMARFFLVYLPVGFVCAYCQNLLQGALKLGSFNALRLLIAAAYLVGVLGLMLVGGGAVWRVALALLGSYLAGAAAGLFLVYRHLRPRWTWDPEVRREMLRYGLHAYGGHVAQILHPQVVLLAMTVMLPTAAIGYYAVGYSLATTLLIIPAGVGAVTLAQGARGSAGRAHQILHRSLHLTLALLLPAAAALYFAAPALLQVFFGPDFLPAVTATRILLLAIPLLAATQVLYEGLRALGHPQGASHAGLAGIAATLPLLWLLLPRYSYRGGAVAFALSCLVALVVVLWYAQRRAAVPLRVLVRSAWTEKAGRALATASLAEDPVAASEDEVP
jgi:O-antigen/teichoic acid export membrane protein